MNKRDVIHLILKKNNGFTAKAQSAKVFAPTNIALCKYWGKANQELNIPITPSVSISLTGKGTWTQIKLINEQTDRFILNGKEISSDSSFAARSTQFLNLFRNEERFEVDITSNIPIAAGLASSASGFASLVLALNDLYTWNLSRSELSILARLGSGSACRSLWNGFVEWQVGSDENGMDSYGIPLEKTWPDLCIGLLIVSQKEKPISSREAMERTKNTSSLYSLWPNKVAEDLPLIKKAIETEDFPLLGKTAESNAMTMHAMMLSAWPPISYFQPETISSMQKIWALRESGIPIYFTQDAGPNLKLLFLKDTLELVTDHFPEIEIVKSIH